MKSLMYLKEKGQEEGIISHNRKLKSLRKGGGCWLGRHIVLVAENSTEETM